MIYIGFSGSDRLVFALQCTCICYIMGSGYFPFSSKHCFLSLHINIAAIPCSSDVLRDPDLGEGRGLSSAVKLIIMFNCYNLSSRHSLSDILYYFKLWCYLLLQMN